MKRELGLIREIMLCLEADDRNLSPSNERLKDWTKDEIGHHVWLALSAGLLDGTEITGFGDNQKMALAFGLTWDGHDFLAAARDDSVWAKVTQMTIVQTGAVTLAVLKELLVRTTRERLRLGE